MRRKISKKVRRQCVQMGAKIIKEEWIADPDWQRKDCGYSVEALYRGWKVISGGYDELGAYRLLYRSMIEWDIGEFKHKDCYGKCDQCVWDHSIGCSEWG